MDTKARLDALLAAGKCLAGQGRQNLGLDATLVAELEHQARAA